MPRQPAATLRCRRRHLPALRPFCLHPAGSCVPGTTGPAGPLVLVSVHGPAQLTAAKLLVQQGRADLAYLLTLLK